MPRGKITDLSERIVTVKRLKAYTKNRLYIHII